MAWYIGSSGSSFDRQRQAKEAQSILRGSDAPLRLCRPQIMGDVVHEKKVHRRPREWLGSIRRASHPNALTHYSTPLLGCRDTE